MMTKEEKARLKSIRMLLVEIVQEVDVMLGDAPLGKREFTTAKVKKKRDELGANVVSDEAAKRILEHEASKKVSDPKGPMKIGDLNIGDADILIEGEILEVQRIAGTTKEKEGAPSRPYEKVSVMLSDKSGPIKLVLWNEQVAELENLQVNDVIRVEAWKVEKGYKGGVHELVYGKFGTINKVNVEQHII